MECGAGQLGCFDRMILTGSLPEARRSPQAVAKIQRRVSMAGVARWHITNWKQVGKAMPKRA